MNNDKYYEIDGKKIPRVTTILSIINKPFLIPWAKAQAREATIEAVWEWIEPYLYHPEYTDELQHHSPDISKEKLREIITESVKAHEKVAQKALDIGSVFHDVIDTQFKTKKSIDDCIGLTTEKLQITLSETEKENILKMTDTYFEVLIKEQVEILASEQTVHYNYDFAGTLDSVGSIKGESGIIDLKTSKKHNKGEYKVPLDYRYQTEAYRRAYVRGLEREDPNWCEVTSFLPIPKRFLFRLDKENPQEYDFIDLDENQDMKDKDWQGFLACKIIYDAQKAIPK